MSLTLSAYVREIAKLWSNGALVVHRVQMVFLMMLIYSFLG